MPANGKFVEAKFAEAIRGVNFQLLTRASTPEKARSSASGSEPSQHILNPKVAEFERGTARTAAIDRDFLHTLSSSFPYALALVLLLTLILVTRAFPLDRAGDQGRAVNRALLVPP